ncbi:MAG: DUF4340 domain-containing protein [Candidatus Competibacteraceae bacterium]|jgi:hypothetical protein|nr:DUF4340 domain-containing protein [Candidatus Competibacteraceae bacterium]
MNRKNFIVLGLVTIAFAGIVIVFSLQDRWAHQAEPTQRFLPELQARLNDITRLQVQIAGAEPATVERQGERWVVAEKSGYPADTGLLRKELLTLAQLERLEAMTRKPEKYERLGLQSIDQEGSAARQIQVWAGEQPLVKMLAGKTGPSNGTYVRLLDDPQSWLSSANITSPSRPEDWLDKELLSLTQNQIHRVVLQSPEGEAYTLTNPDPNALSFVLEPIPEGKRVKMGEPQRIAGALNALRLTDVVPAVEAPRDDTTLHSARFEAFDGLAIDVQSWKVEDKHYLKLHARFHEAITEPFRKPAEDGQTKPMPALPPLDQVKATAKQLEDRFKDWTFIIPDFKAELFTMSEDQLLEDEPAPEPSPEEQEAPATSEQAQPAVEEPVGQEQSTPLVEPQPVESEASETGIEADAAKPSSELTDVPAAEQAQPVPETTEPLTDQPQAETETADTPIVEKDAPTAEPVEVEPLATEPKETEIPTEQLDADTEAPESDEGVRISPHHPVPEAPTLPATPESSEVEEQEHSESAPGNSEKIPVLPGNGTEEPVNPKEATQD